MLPRSRRQICPTLALAFVKREYFSSAKEVDTSGDGDVVILMEDGPDKTLSRWRLDDCDECRRGCGCDPF